MQLKPFFEKINLRLIAVHAVAMWMFIYAFMLLGSLYYLPVTRVLWQHPKVHFGPEDNKAFSNHTPGYFLTFFFFAPVVGLLAGFIVSLAISVFRKWFWPNSLFAFIIIFFLYRFDLSGWQYLRVVFLAPGTLIKGNLGFYLATNAFFLLTIGLMLFFLKPVNNFITGSSLASKSHTG